ncbi:oxygen-independent coproporphyrinogen III oxidase [Methylocella sp.]|uniref:oxygen-independent coproporphyrinogen III oxidase n=1 Tax=Methylocella sp. TaxID=1978226 RepID=UPI0037840A9F
MTHENFEPTLDPGLVARHARALPRYTSYPTANHFHAGVDQTVFRGWLASLRRDAPVSAYVHVPFCQELCWYCGCSTKATRRYAPVSAYVEALEAELAALAGALGFSPKLKNLHFGGGSPDILTPQDVARLVQALAGTFAFEPGLEFAVEIDPRLMNEQKADAFARAGVTRVSFGVQDFDERVQKAIGRMQSFAATRAAVEAFRARGVGSVNLDLVYGLPRQTLASLEATLQAALSLSPDRLALFGYAHLPQRIANQRLIDEATLPGAQERFEQARLAERVLRRAGYVQLGIDHFAKPDDKIAQNQISRNFQGYTDDACGALIGIGASAISRLPQGYAQNAVPVGVHAELVKAGGLATRRGFALAPEDEMRGFVIERLMCDFSFPGRALAERYGGLAEPLAREAREALAADADGFLEPTLDGFRLREWARPFARQVAARFDAYLGAGGARHSLAV